MKFFTRKWFVNANYERQSEPIFSAYTKHLESLEGKLPANVIQLANLSGIDDGWIVEVDENTNHRILTLTMRCGNLRIGYFDLTVRYEGASMSPCDRWILARLARRTDGIRGNTDLAYHEIDRNEEGRIEHRYLFIQGGGLPSSVTGLHIQ